MHPVGNRDVILSERMKFDMHPINMHDDEYLMKYTSTYTLYNDIMQIFLSLLEVKI